MCGEKDIKSLRRPLRFVAREGRRHGSTPAWYLISLWRVFVDPLTQAVGLKGYIVAQIHLFRFADVSGGQQLVGQLLPCHPNQRE